MIHSASIGAAKASPLTQQQADFTAEGGPPPGSVAGHAPASAASKPAPGSAAVAHPKARNAALSGER